VTAVGKAIEERGCHFCIAKDADWWPGRRGFRDQRSGQPAVPHGLRSTFRDWTSEQTNYPRDMAEMALAHFIGSEVERAYRRGDMLEKRGEMVAAWEGLLLAAGGVHAQELT